MWNEYKGKRRWGCEISRVKKVETGGKWAEKRGHQEMSTPTNYSLKNIIFTIISLGFLHI